MAYDFCTFVDRRGKDSLAADVIPFDGLEVETGWSVIPMWVADMSFPAAPFIIEGMKKRLETPSFGYFSASDEYYDAIIKWHKTRKGDTGLSKENIGYENGVLGGVSSAIKAFSSPGDCVLIHSPVYVGFSGTLELTGRKLIKSELVRDQNGVWRMDYEDMARKIKENRIHLAIFCSPHNPCGRVWEKWEIEKAMQIYKENDCIVISDEIWSDIIMPGYTHIPTQSISEDAKMRTMAFYAPSKTFSLAGLVGSYHVIYNSMLRDRVRKIGEATRYNAMNVLSMHALISAYSPDGNNWTDEMIEEINRNFEFACSFIKEKFHGVKVMKPEGTYMLYLDCTDWCRDRNESIESLLARGVKKGVIWQNGEAFHMKNTIRLNLALPNATLVEAFERLEKFAFT